MGVGLAQADRGQRAEILRFQDIHLDPQAGAEALAAGKVDVGFVIGVALLVGKGRQFEYCHHNQMQTARAIGIGWNVLRTLLKQFGVIQESCWLPNTSVVCASGRCWDYGNFKFNAPVFRQFGRHESC